MKPVTAAALVFAVFSAFRVIGAFREHARLERKADTEDERFVRADRIRILGMVVAIAGSLPLSFGLAYRISTVATLGEVMIGVGVAGVVVGRVLRGS